MNITILFQDQDLAVVEKPAGLVVNKAKTVKDSTLQDWWEEYLLSEAAAQSTPTEWKSLIPTDFLAEYGTPEEIFAERGGIVHRLDKETSGVMVLAKNPGALVNLLKQFRERQVQKMYTCLVHGKFQILEDTVSLPLGRSVYNRTKFSVTTEGRAAETAYKVLQTLPELDAEQVAKLPGAAETRNLRKKIRSVYQGFSLVQCWPKTGRTHQIRVHMAHLHHPIVSDETYLGKKRSSLDLVWCPRLFLHATELRLHHPRSGEEVTFRSELPEDLQGVIGLFSQ